MTARIKKKGLEKGIGLLEVIVAMFIISILLVGLVGVQRLVGESYNFSFDEMQAIEQARGGIDILLKEIREAKSAEDGSYPLAQADDQELVFFADVNDDNKAERVRYFLNGLSLVRGVIQPTDTVPPTYPQENEETKVIAEYIQNGADPIFYYYNDSWPLVSEGNPLDTPARLLETKYMRVFLRININPQIKPQDYELSSGVALRNLKDNL